jgi:hypothetical protein
VRVFAAEKFRGALIGLSFFTTFCGVQSGNAATLISSSVTSDAPGFYTYNYVIDNTAGDSPVSEFGILVTASLTPGPPPVSFTAPTGWILSSGVSGSIANPPYNESGGFEEFIDVAGPADEAPAGETLSGFSFSVYSTPTDASSNNYYALGGDPEIVGYGITLAPNLYTPLPPSWSLMLLGLAPFYLAARRNRRILLGV